MTPEHKRVQSFNESYGIGKTVSYANDKGEVITSQVRFPAEVLDHCGIAVVWVSGDYNSVNLSNVII